MLHAIMDLLDNSAHIDSQVPLGAYTASNKCPVPEIDPRQDSLCTYTTEGLEFLDTLVHIHVHMMTCMNIRL